MTKTSTIEGISSAYNCDLSNISAYLTALLTIGCTSFGTGIQIQGIT